MWLAHRPPACRRTTRPGAGREPLSAVQERGWLTAHRRATHAGRSGRGRRPLVVDAGRLLTGEAPDGAHDPVGQVTTGAAARHAVVLVGDGDRLADPHGDVDLAQPRAVRA